MFLLFLLLQESKYWLPTRLKIEGNTYDDVLVIVVAGIHVLVANPT